MVRGLNARFRYFQEVLGSNLLPNGTSEIELHKDGSWSVQNAEKKPVVPKPDKVPLEDSIEIISDDVGKSVCIFLLSCFIFARNQ